MYLRSTFPVFFLLFVPVAHADFKDGGEAYKRGDFTAAAREFRPLAERGDHRAMYALGSMYAAGLGVEKNLERAHALFLEAARNGRIDAMYKLGLMYEEGLGVSQDYARALRYYRKSAQQGYPLSQYRFGLMYINGRGLQENLVTGSAWLIIAGHYFIYESGKTEQPIEAGAGFERQILFTQQQELDRITRALANQLESVHKQLSPDDIAAVRNKVIDFGKYKKHYHSKATSNIRADGLFEELFLPPTLF